MVTMVMMVAMVATATMLVVLLSPRNDVYELASRLFDEPPHNKRLHNNLRMVSRAPLRIHCRCCSFILDWQSRRT